MRTYVAGGATITFTLQGSLPGELEADKDVYITCWGVDFVKGVLVNKDKIEVLQRQEDCTIEVENEGQFVDHLPEADYLYEYENPLLQCENCKSEVPLNEIEEDFSYDEIPLTTCPVCGHTNTFEELEYEKVGDVVKELSITE